MLLFLPGLNGKKKNKKKMICILKNKLIQNAKNKKQKKRKKKNFKK